MGLLFVERLEGEGVFRCRRCRVDAASKDAIISRDFYGRTGRAYLFDHVCSIQVEAEEVLEEVTPSAPELAQHFDRPLTKGKAEAINTLADHGKQDMGKKKRKKKQLLAGGSVAPAPFETEVA
ncbi:hypothetical protein BS78_08G173600 [Paspalum vaginatum]|nr:hypothetical protein BS78_08G173600 [Paspalum vaginatum]